MLPLSLSLSPSPLLCSLTDDWQGWIGDVEREALGVAKPEPPSSVDREASRQSTETDRQEQAMSKRGAEIERERERADRGENRTGTTRNKKRDGKRQEDCKETERHSKRD